MNQSLLPNLWLNKIDWALYPWVATGLKPECGHLFPALPKSVIGSTQASTAIMKECMRVV